MKDTEKQLLDLYDRVQSGTIDLERAKVLLSIIDRMPRD